MLGKDAKYEEEKSGLLVHDLIRLVIMPVPKRAVSPLLMPILRTTFEDIILKFHSTNGIVKKKRQKIKCIK